MADTELAKSLQEAKKKPRNFALIAKGPNVVHLLVQKKPIQPVVLQKLKQEHGGKAVVKGVVVGAEGGEMVFRLAEPAPVGEVKLRTFITDTAELHLKPRFELVQVVEEVDEEDLPLPKSLGQKSGEPKSGEQKEVEQETGDEAGQFQARLKSLKPDIKRVKNAGGPIAKELEPLVLEMSTLAKNTKYDQALVKLGDVEKVVKRGLEELTTQAKRGGAKVTSGASTALSEKDSGELSDRLDDALARCPALLDHIAKTMGGNNGASIYFSDVAKDAFYTSKGDKGRGIPDNVIILPKKGKTPQDLLDGLIFETCNVEIQHEYDKLTKDYLAALDDEPIDVQKFGAQKATIEAKAVLKNAQLLFQARKSKVDVAYQGNRNLLAMLRTCLELEGKSLPDYDKIIGDPQQLSEYLAANEEKLGAFLDGADKDPSVREAVLNSMANTPHNRNCEKPTDKNGLKTCDLYAYELLETAPGQVVQMIEHEIGKVVDLASLPMDELRPWLTDRIGRYDGDDKSARQTMVKRVIADLKKMFPELAGGEFSCLAFSPDMDKMAQLRLEDYKTRDAKKFNEAKRDALHKALEVLNNALLAGVKFLETFESDVKKDTRPVLANLADLSTVAGIPQVIARMNKVQTGETPVLAAKDAASILSDLQGAVMGALEPYNEYAMALDIDEGTAPALKQGAAGMASAVKAMPSKLAKPMQMPLKFFVIAIDDLATL